MGGAQKIINKKAVKKMNTFPIGFAAMLGSDPELMEQFLNLPQAEQRKIIEKAANANTRAEMLRLKHEIR